MLAEYELSPWGEVAGDVRAATVGIGIAKAALHNSISAEDFMPNFKRNDGQSPDDMRKILRGMTGRK